MAPRGLGCAASACSAFKRDRKVLGFACWAVCLLFDMEVRGTGGCNYRAFVAHTFGVAWVVVWVTMGLGFTVLHNDSPGLCIIMLCDHELLSDQSRQEDFLNRRTPWNHQNLLPQGRPPQCLRTAQASHAFTIVKCSTSLKTSFKPEWGIPFATLPCSKQELRDPNSHTLL
eukprot:2887647-Amphidinium_carterae.1